MEPQGLNLMDQALGFHSNMTQQPWPLCGRFVLVEDCVDTSGAFVLHHILKRSFTSRPSSAVIFLAFAHPINHYDRVLRKLCPVEGKPKHDGLATVFEKIERVISELHPENKKFVTVVIDDISCLEVAANGSSNDVLDFLHYCYTLTSENGYALVALNHQDIYSDGERPAFMLEIEYLADILIKVDPLATGLAKDVHGQVMVLNKETQKQQGISSIKIQNFHFKIKENNIEYFYAGTRT
ncbi:elongator complex protein 6 isoform X2 [Arachis ipaensis]|uniref:elongator complex protein 6 isoform X2 n=1 Tax=Arachis ipaensis TaxID=130454 RepID=UPI000A2B922A|nr:elongator complex protein 6 isoform X2 [Arachis ipaensis]